MGIAHEQAREYGILRNVLDGTPAAVEVLDHGLRYLYVNPTVSRLSGLPPESFIGRTLSEVMPDVHRGDEALRMVLADGECREVPLTGRTRARSPFRRRQWNMVYHRLEEGDGQVLGLCGIGVEISALREYVDDLESAHQRLALLDTATTRVGTTLDVDRTCIELAEFVAPSMADACAVDVVEDGTASMAPPPGPGIVRVRVAAVSGDPDILRHLARGGRLGEIIDIPRHSPIRRSLATGRPWKANLGADEVFHKMVLKPENLALYRAAGIHSLLAVPLPTRGHPVGVCFLARAGDSPPFTEDDVLVAQDLASRAAVTIDHARRYTLEHTMALELQRALLSEPGAPHPDVEVASRYLPAGHSALVGGDWFDSIALPDGRTLQVMGDVMGHGFTAAVAMTQYRSLLRSLAVADTSVDGILEDADHRLANMGLDRVATCQLVLIDPARATFTVASAGHLPPVLLREDGATLVPVRSGPPLGTEQGGYESLTMPFPPGSVLLLYTDGLVEHRGMDIDASLRRLTDLRIPLDGPLDDIIEAVLARLVLGTAEDDVALLAARTRAA
ncbi:SpoIIE family protein phosphatase [Streptomyces sp. GC420]|nr:SpoIIE family protein phosphatase [Streptomyces sp. GC420]